MGESSMTSKSLGAALGLAACLILSACNSSGGVGNMSSGETAGTGLGAAGGGLIGYAISGSPAGVIIGMAAGGLIGNRLSNALDGNSQEAAGQAAARAAACPAAVCASPSSAFDSLLPTRPPAAMPRRTPAGPPEMA